MVSLRIFNQLYFQLWVAYAPCGSQHKDAVQITLEQIDLIKRFIEQYSGNFQHVTTSEGSLLLQQISYYLIGEELIIFLPISKIKILCSKIKKSTFLVPDLKIFPICSNIYNFCNLLSTCVIYFTCKDLLRLTKLAK